MHTKTEPAWAARWLILAFLLITQAQAGPKLTFDDGKKSLELVQAYQLWSVDS